MTWLYITAGLLVFLFGNLWVISLCKAAGSHTHG